MDAKGAEALRDRIERSLGPGGRYSIPVETEEDAAELTRLLGVNVRVGDRVEGRVTVSPR